MMALQPPAAMTDELLLPQVVSRESRPPMRSLTSSNTKGPAAADFLDADKFLGGDTDDDDDDDDDDDNNDDDNKDDDHHDDEDSPGEDDQKIKDKVTAEAEAVEVLESKEPHETTTTTPITTPPTRRTSIDERRECRRRERQAGDKQTRTAKLKARSLSPPRHRNRGERSQSPSRTFSSALNADPSLQAQHPDTVHRSVSAPLNTRQTPARSLSAHVGETAVQFLELFGLMGDEDDEVVDEDNFDDYRVQPRDMQALVNDPTEFSRLKAALKEKGAITNEVLRQRLHVYVHKNRSRWTSSSSSTTDGSTSTQADDNNAAMNHNLSAFRRDDD